MTFRFRPFQIEEKFKALKAELEVLKTDRPASGGVDAALQLVRQPASAPARLRDPTLISSALQSLTDEARCADHRKAAEFEAIIRQRRSLLYRPEYGDIIIRLFRTKEETAVASTIAKMVKGTRQPLISTPDGGGVTELVGVKDVIEWCVFLAAAQAISRYTAHREIQIYIVIINRISVMIINN